MHFRLEELVERYPKLGVIADDIQKSFDLMYACAKSDNTILVCGNGGNSADSDHIVGELMKSFVKKRPVSEELQSRLKEISPEFGQILSDTLEGTIRAINLTTHAALTTAYSNDRNPEIAIAQQVNGYGREGDVLFAMSTSGNSKNVIMASVVAKAKGMHVIAMTGDRKSKLGDVADVTLRIPETETFKVQELGLPIYHCLCLMLEDSLWKD